MPTATLESDSRHVNTDNQAPVIQEPKAPLEEEASLLLTVRDLSRLLSVSVPTLWRWDASGKLPRAIKIGGIKRWPRATIEEWITLGCIPQKEFEALRTAERRHKR